MFRLIGKPKLDLTLSLLSRTEPPRNQEARHSRSSELNLQLWILPRVKSCMEMMLKVFFVLNNHGQVLHVLFGVLMIDSWMSTLNLIQDIMYFSDIYLSN